MWGDAWAPARMASEPGRRVGGRRKRRREHTVDGRELKRSSRPMLPAPATPRPPSPRTNLGGQSREREWRVLVSGREGRSKRGAQEKGRE